MRTVITAIGFRISRLSKVAILDMAGPATALTYQAEVSVVPKQHLLI
ncbi:hypothetical protein GCM10007874_53990 [Labrys miyagiensis]|uniref:Uncharacterized protein n=1 Tax=Labrys miyagiensis TaxID=346912 RepID=A0ABQ6CPU7_9HYPH|nr:hypothetical protein [Labrys miyagiensis]GLS22381.1 hypothetical protein GCM10007874_53990 [Labrys miyagiensis]